MIARRYQQGSLTRPGDVAHPGAGNVACDHGQGCAHGLQQHQAEGLGAIQRRQAEGLGRGVRALQLGVAHVPRQAHAPAQTERGNARAQMGFLLARTDE